MDQLFLRQHTGHHRVLLGLRRQQVHFPLLVSAGRLQHGQEVVHWLLLPVGKVQFTQSAAIGVVAVVGGALLALVHLVAQFMLGVLLTAPQVLVHRLADALQFLEVLP